MTLEIISRFLAAAVIVAIAVPTSAAAAGDEALTPMGKLYCLVTDERSSSFQLALMNADGSDFQMVPTAKRFCLFPAPSPDGSRIAYSAFDRNEGRGPAAIKLYLAGADGADPVRLTDSVGQASWAPDGKHLLATRLLFQGGQPVGSRIEVLDLKGTTTKDLGPGCCATWAPINNRLACLTAVENTNDVALTLMNADGLGRDVIENSADGDPLRVSPYCCAWSADARQVAVAQRVGAGERMVTFLAIVEVETRQVRQLAQLSTKDGDLLTASWSPDGKWLAYAVERDDISRIFIVPVDGGTARAVSPGDKHCFMPAWSR